MPEACEFDWIGIHDLKVKTHIGIHSWEQKIEQTLLLDIACAVSLPENITNLSASVDYAAISMLVIEFVQNNSFQLIEMVAQQVAQLILDKFLVKIVKIKVTKPYAVKEAQAGVSVSISRRASQP